MERGYSSDITSAYAEVRDDVRSGLVSASASPCLLLLGGGSLRG